MRSHDLHRNLATRQCRSSHTCCCRTHNHHARSAGSHWKPRPFPPSAGCPCNDCSVVGSHDPNARETLKCLASCAHLSLLSPHPSLWFPTSSHLLFSRKYVWRCMGCHHPRSCSFVDSPSTSKAPHQGAQRQMSSFA